MDIEFYMNPRPGEPHCLDHGVTEEEVIDILDEPIAVYGARNRTLAAVGQNREAAGCG